MMINKVTIAVQGLGIDIESVTRFRALPYKKNRVFYRKIFTAREIKYCLKKRDPYPHFAARFCAKEAVIKTLKRSVVMNEIEVVLKKGKPSVEFIRGGDEVIFLSLSHTKEYAIALAILK